MEIKVSGLSEQECMELVGPDFWQENSVRWVLPESLFDSDLQSRALWLYRSPWSASRARANSAGADTTRMLERWRQENLAFLNSRRTIKGDVLVVNADRVSVAAIREKIAGGDVQPSRTEPISQPFDALLGLLFEKFAPRYWDIVEALEAVAWNPQSEPLFRGAASSSEEDLPTLLQVISAYPGLLNERAERNKLAAQHDARMAQILRENGELKEQRSHVLKQLEQLGEEAELHLLERAKWKEEKRSLQLQMSGLEAELLGGDGKRQPWKKRILSKIARPGYQGSKKLHGILTKIIKKRELNTQLDEIEISGWFDGQWYLDKYPDVLAASMNPLEHYCEFGWKEMRDPCERFSTEYYLRTNQDVFDSGLNPLWHYIRFGRAEGRLSRGEDNPYARFGA